MKLNPRQEKFCLEYARTGNATQAYKSAGFKSKSYQAAQANSARLLADERIQARLRDLAAETKSAAIATVTELQEGLTAVFRGQVTTSVVTKDGEVVEVQAAIKDRLKAAEILCKTFGAFVNKQELNIMENIPVVIVDDVG